MTDLPEQARDWLSRQPTHSNVNMIEVCGLVRLMVVEIETRKSFYELAIRERDLAQHRNQRLRAENERLWGLIHEKTAEIDRLRNER